MDNPSQNPLDLLNRKQRKFVERYCVHLNAARAAREAGYSPESAKQIGSENLTKPDVLSAVQHLLTGQSMSNEEGLTRLTNWARGSVEPFIDEQGRLTITSDEATDNLHLIKKVKQTRRIELGKGKDDPSFEVLSTEIELHDAKDAVVKLLEASGKLVKKHEHSFTDLDRLTPEQLEQLRLLQEAIQQK